MRQDLTMQEATNGDDRGNLIVKTDCLLCGYWLTNSRLLSSFAKVQQAAGLRTFHFRQIIVSADDRTLSKKQCIKLSRSREEGTREERKEQMNNQSTSTTSYRTVLLLVRVLVLIVHSTLL